MVERSRLLVVSPVQLSLAQARAASDFPFIIYQVLIGVGDRGS